MTHSANFYYVNLVVSVRVKPSSACPYQDYSQVQKSY
jgi:hypothetical protein